jgi:uncharacterized phage infection (PIP) family protein YhgE
MPTKKTPQVTFTPAQQAVRARLATLNPTQFEALRSVLQQMASAVDIRIAQLDAERGQLADQKRKLSAALTEFAKPAALDKLRDVILKGQKFTAPAIGKIQKPKKPKEPGP